MIKPGDNVRFLNAVGGGIVTKTDEKKNLAYVRDEDGFEVPVLFRECVVIGQVSKTTNFPKKDFGSKPAATTSQPAQPAPPQEPAIIEIPIVETAEGDKLNVLLAFFPTEIKKLTESSYQCYLVNDSNYFLYYNFVAGETGMRKSIAHGTIEPNMQEHIANAGKEQLNNWQQIRVQLIAFKKDKTYQEQNVLDFNLKINPVKFYKLHSFTTTDYFDEPCMLIDLVEACEKKRLADISPEEIKQAIHHKSQPKIPLKVVDKKLQNQILEIDLHIGSLLETTSGLSNADMLNYQLDVVRKTLDENRNNKGKKIVFIHGKGEGVLRSEIEKLLKSKYKSCYFQDASFIEYGFGATQVTIK